MGHRDRRIRTAGCPSNGGHKGHRQCQMERKTRRMNRFDTEAFCRYRLYPSPEEGFKYLLISGGDVRGRMNLHHTKYLEKDVLFVQIEGVPHTVLKMSDRAVLFLKKAKTLRAFYNSFRSILAETDIRQYFYDIWVMGQNINAQIANQTELYRQNEARRNGTSTKKDAVASQVKEFSRSIDTVRKAARAYGVL